MFVWSFLISPWTLYITNSLLSTRDKALLLHTLPSSSNLNHPEKSITYQQPTNFQMHTNNQKNKVTLTFSYTIWTRFTNSELTISTFLTSSYWFYSCICSTLSGPWSHLESFIITQQNNAALLTQNFVLYLPLETCYHILIAHNHKW